MSRPINDDLNEVLGQIAWANGLPERCKPFTPTDAEVTAGYAKLRGNLTWGCKLHAYWAADVESAKQEDPKGWKRWIEPDVGHLIALPGHQDELHDGVAWFPKLRGDESDTPVWQVLSLLLANPQIGWVEVAK